mgnify:CR=1 FL=1
MVSVVFSGGSGHTLSLPTPFGTWVLYFINRPPTPNILICILLEISFEVKEMANDGRELGDPLKS